MKPGNRPKGNGANSFRIFILKDEEYQLISLFFFREEALNLRKSAKTCCFNFFLHYIIERRILNGKKIIYF